MRRVYVGEWCDWDAVIVLGLDVKSEQCLRGTETLLYLQSNDGGMGRE